MAQTLWGAVNEFYYFGRTSTRNGDGDKDRRNIYRKSKQAFEWNKAACLAIIVILDKVQTTYL